jgi:hypothetical protein
MPRLQYLLCLANSAQDIGGGYAHTANKEYPRKKNFKQLREIDGRWEQKLRKTRDGNMTQT